MKPSAPRVQLLYSLISRETILDNKRVGLTVDSDAAMMVYSKPAECEHECDKQEHSNRGI